MRSRIFLPIVIALLATACGETPPPESQAEAEPALPEVRLVLISPHNTDIQKEYEAAYVKHHAARYGERVTFEWRDVGGGASSILSHLRNVYELSLIHI